MSNKKNLVKLSVSRVWKDLGSQDDEMTWYNVVWFPSLIPRHSFIIWLRVQERLLTQDKLIKRYPQKVMSCALCDNESDSHEHLFIECHFSTATWSKAWEMSNINTRNNDWKLSCS